MAPPTVMLRTAIMGAGLLPARGVTACYWCQRLMDAQEILLRDGVRAAIGRDDAVQRARALNGEQALRAGMQAPLVS